MITASIHAGARRAAFTLVELLVVLAVILVLVGLTVSVSVSVLGQAEVRETRSTLQLLTMAIEEWELAAGRSLTYGINDPGNNRFYDIQMDPNDDSIAEALRVTDQIIDRLRRNEVSRDILSRISPQFLRAIDPDNVPASIARLQAQEDYSPSDAFDQTPESFWILDSWDQPILAIHPGPVWPHESYTPPVDAPNDDDTVRTPLENRLGVAQNRQMYFISAGPNERFGDLRLDQPLNDVSNTPSVIDASDNVYSYDVLINSVRPQS